jgi:hypothetical protein
MAEAKVDGYSKTKKVGGVSKDFSVSTMRFSSPGTLDVVVTGDGGKSVLQMLKEVAQQIVELEIPNPLPSNWSQIVKAPKTGTKVTITFGIRSEFQENAE